MIYIIFTNKLFHYLKEKVIVMRKITLLVLLFAVVGNIKAAHYEYIPLVRDGVEWGYSQQLLIIRKELLSKSDTSRYHCQ